MTPFVLLWVEMDPHIVFLFVLILPGLLKDIGRARRVSAWSRGGKGGGGGFGLQ